MADRRVTCVEVERLFRSKETVWGQIRTALMREQTDPAHLRLLRDAYARLEERATDALTKLATQTPAQTTETIAPDLHVN